MSLFQTVPSVLVTSHPILRVAGSNAKQDVNIHAIFSVLAIEHGVECHRKCQCLSKMAHAEMQPHSFPQRLPDTPNKSP
jgi:hypothetical protein